MRIMMLTAAALLMVPALAQAAPAGDPESRLNPKQAQALAKALKGKVPGKTVSCLPPNPSPNMQVISDEIILYKYGANSIYRADLAGGCSGLSRGGTLVTNPGGGRLCQGDIARVVDFPTRMTVGSCGFSGFTPYTSAR